MRAAARVRARFENGRTRLVDLRSDPPLVLRPTPAALYVVGGAAGPIGGDHLEFDVDVEAGAALRITSAAATLALPGPSGLPSRSCVRLRVDDRAAIVWQPRPLVSVAESAHTIDTRVAVTGTGRLVLFDEVVLGRTDEPSGAVRMRTRVERDGAPVVVHDIALGAGVAEWNSGVPAGHSRAFVSLLVVGADAVAPVAAEQVTHEDDGSRAAWFVLDQGAALMQAVGPTLSGARRAATRVGAVIEH